MQGADLVAVFIVRHGIAEATPGRCLSILTDKVNETVIEEDIIQACTEVSKYMRRRGLRSVYL